MFKFKRGAIVAYRDVLAYIRKVDKDQDDPKVKKVFEYVEERLDMYLNPENYTKDID